MNVERKLMLFCHVYTPENEKTSKVLKHTSVLPYRIT